MICWLEFQLICNEEPSDWDMNGEELGVIRDASHREL